MLTTIIRTHRTCFELGKRVPSYTLLLGQSTTKHSSIIFHRGTKNLPPVPKKPTPQGNVQSVWNKLFGKYLLATNVISSGVLMVVGDVAAQELEFRKGLLKERYDLNRMWRMFVVGSLQGPLHHYSYRWMDKIMPEVNTKNSIKKILIDQIVMSPVCILLFFYPACFLENKTLSETNNEIISKFPYIYIADWSVWPAAQYVNFQYLDPKYRVMFVNVMTAVYNVFISYIKHDEGGDFLGKFL
ncbi:mpv17-like protein 2 isoform X2 [Eupeodes corollae]|nr:mpv17-like protein 2 isoform X2 [Eupeodes corollae]